MKRYINASDGSKQKTLQNIRREINKDIQAYYEAWGYDTREYSIPKCSIKKQQDSDSGKAVYKITVNMDVFDTYPSFTNITINNLNQSVQFWLNNDFEILEDFLWDGNTTFTSYIVEI